MKEECKNKIINIRKKYFIKEIKNEIRKKKYNKLIYLKHDKIFSFAIGIINLKNKSINGLRSKSKSFQIKMAKKYFNIFKQRAKSNNKLKTNTKLINKYLYTMNYKKFIEINLFNISIKKKMKALSSMHKTIYLKKYIRGIDICFKMKLIDKKVDDYYKTKRKKNFLNILKKRYQNSIKYSMLSLRFNEYLIISSFNSFFRAINKNKNESIQIGFNNNA